MFTLCMSRGPPHQDSQHNNIRHKQIKAGYLLRHRRGFFCKTWSEEWAVLYEDSTLAWFADKGLSRPRGWVRIRDAPDLLAVGEWTHRVPHRRPALPPHSHLVQVMAIGAGQSPADPVHWFIAQNIAEINDWMNAISKTLPPPHMPLDNRRLSLTPCQTKLLATSKLNGNVKNGNCKRSPPDKSLQNLYNTSPHHYETIDSPPHHYHTPAKNKNTAVALQQSQQQQQQELLQQKQGSAADYTLVSGVAIDWGHGWGWGQTAWAAQSAAAAAAATSTTCHGAAIYCHAAGVDDYALGGCDEVDWSAFGDFSF